MADTDASGSGTHQVKQKAPIAGVTNIQVEAPEPEMEDDIEPPTCNEAITTFVASQLFAEPD